MSEIGTGFNWRTGRLIDGWTHTVQSLEILFGTRFGERERREWFGSLVPVLLGENLTVGTVLRTKQAIIVAIETWEPRFRITRIRSLSVGRDGRYGLELGGIYRPRAHLGDFRAEGPRRLVMGASADRSGVNFEPV